MSAFVPIDPPIRVMLRDRSHAFLTHGVGDMRPFIVFGHAEGDRSAVHVWRKSGRWREDGASHNLDIVAIYTIYGERLAFAGIDLRKVKG